MMKRFILIASGLFSALSLLAGDNQRTFIGFANGVTNTSVSLQSLSNNSVGMPMSFSFYHSVGGMSNSLAHATPLIGWKFFGEGLLPQNLTDGNDGISLYSTLTGTNDDGQIIATPHALSLAASAGFWFYGDLPYVATVNYDILTIYSTNGSSFANVFLQLNGGETKYRIGLEDPSGLYPGLDVDRLTLYWVSVLRHKGSSNAIAIYDSTGTNNLFMGYTPQLDGGTADSFGFGGSSITAGTAVGGYYIDSVMLDYSDNPEWPLLPGKAGLGVIRANNLNTGTMTNLAGRSP